MRITISLMLLCCIPPALSAREEYKRDFQKTAALPAGRTLRVDHSLGSVNVHTQAKNEVAVQAPLRRSGDKAGSAGRLFGHNPIPGEGKESCWDNPTQKSGHSTPPRHASEP